MSTRVREKMANSERRPASTFFVINGMMSDPNGEASSEEEELAVMSCSDTNSNSEMKCRLVGLSVHCTASRKVAGVIPDTVIGTFHWLNPSGRTVALGSTHPPTAMSTERISCRLKTAGAYGRQPFTFMCQLSRNSGNLNLLEPQGPVLDCIGICFTFA